MGHEQGELTPSCSQNWHVADSRAVLCAGAPGMPQMTDEELMQSTIQSAASRVAKGKVRRKKVGGRRALSELTSLRA